MGEHLVVRAVDLLALAIGHREKALLHMARQWGLPPSDCMMVGDSDDDILAGSAAGFTTVAIGRDAKALALAQHSIQSLAELVPILE